MAIEEGILLFELLGEILRSWRTMLIGAIGAALAVLAVLFVPSLPLGIALGALFLVGGLAAGRGWEKASLR